MSPKQTGTVRWFNLGKGFGFIKRDDGTDVFVHQMAILDSDSRSLTKGQRVSFIEVAGNKGPQAENVTVL